MATKSQSTDNESLYVSMESFKEKRRSLLFSLKDSLVLQEEYEKIMKIREEKEEIMKKIKKRMSDLDQSYQRLKKTFPSVKSAIANTEKELSALDKQFTTLAPKGKEEEKEEEIIIPVRKTKNAKTAPYSSSKQSEKQQNEATGYVSEKASHKINNDITKLDRIKHNLKVIETKLKKS